MLYVNLKYPAVTYIFTISLDLKKKSNNNNAKKHPTAEKMVFETLVQITQKVVIVCLS